MLSCLKQKNQDGNAKNICFLSFTQHTVFFSTPIRIKCVGAVLSFLCAFLVHYWLISLSPTNTSPLLH